MASVSAGVEGAFLEAPDRLTLEELAEEVHERQHQLRQRPLHVVGVGVPSSGAVASRALPELGAERPQLFRADGFHAHPAPLHGHVSAPNA